MFQHTFNLWSPQEHLSLSSEITQIQKIDHNSSQGQNLAVLLISYNTSTCTIKCIESLLHGKITPEFIYILDNSSEEIDYYNLKNNLPESNTSNIKLYKSNQNLGFAAGSNALLHFLMNETSCTHALLLNNDAEATSDMMLSIVNLIQTHAHVDLAGGRMHQLSNKEAIDTLGISIYSSLMPADRKSLDDPLWGPTGGCLLLSRNLYNTQLDKFGYFFDPRYFCYCEDTDLVIRSRLIGFEVFYIDEILAYHQGQASSGGKHNDFIAYHGLRNSIWMQFKLFPFYIWKKWGWLLLIAHFLMITRYIGSGKIKILMKIYIDSIKELKSFLKERKEINRKITVSPEKIKALISPNFYRKGYFKAMIANLLK